MSKIFKDDQDLVSIANAFQNIINKINSLEYFYRAERATLKKDFKRDIFINSNAEIKSEMQERFEKYTYNLETIIKVKRIIEDELFLYDLELEDMEE